MKFEKNDIYTYKVLLLSYECTKLFSMDMQLNMSFGHL